MQCSSDRTADSTLKWTHDAYSATRIPCESTNTSRYTVSQPVPQSDCFITGLGTAAVGNQGIYNCDDGSGIVAEAVAVLIGMSVTRVLL